MKPFNLEEYLKNPLKKVVTRGGTPVKIHCTNYLGANPIIAEIEGSGQSRSFNADGSHFSVESVIDLFFETEKHEGWINILRGGKYICPMVCIYDSKEKAEENANMDRNCVATVKIEWEE